MLLTLVQWWQTGDFSMFDVVILLVSFAAFIFVCMPIHEMAHAFAAHKLGDDTAKWCGRLTFNPIKHLDPIGTLMILTVGIGYARPVPVNPNYFRNRKAGMALTAFAGPLSNLLMAIISVGLYRVILLVVEPQLYQAAMALDAEQMELWLDVQNYSWLILIGVFASINISLAVFNLLPIPPLDGSRIFAMVLPDRFVYTVERYQTYISMVFIVLIFSGALDPVLNGLRHGFGTVICGMFGMDNVF